MGHPPHPPCTGLDGCLRVLQTCFRKRMSGALSTPTTPILDKVASCHVLLRKGRRVVTWSCDMGVSRNLSTTVASILTEPTLTLMPRHERERETDHIAIIPFRDDVCLRDENTFLIHNDFKTESLNKACPRLRDPAS